MRLWSLCCILAVLPAPASPAFADDEDMKKLEGTWKFVSLESDGEKAPAELIANWRWVVKGKEITWGDPIVGESKTSFTVDPDKSPKAIDLTALDKKEKGKTFKGVYQFDGERLKVCLPGGKVAEVNRPRPKEFGGGKGMSLFVLERVKHK